jgi:hypothetical protein
VPKRPPDDAGAPERPPDEAGVPQREDVTGRAPKRLPACMVPSIRLWGQVP